MHSIAPLWLPIIVSTVVVFILSSIINMFLPWHKGDFAPLPNGESIAATLNAANVAAGDYMYPRPAGMEEMRSPEHKERFLRGPVVLMTVARPKTLSMGKQLTSWFIFVLLISALAACMAVMTVPTAGEYHLDHQIFHVVGLFTWVAYALAVWPLSIWYSRSWRSTLTMTLDGLIYAVATGLVFVWLWH